MMDFFKKHNKLNDGDEKILKHWYKDNYERVLIQRNFLVIVLFISLITILLSVSLIRFIKNTASVEPFVIEIDNKSGVPTVVDPVTLIEYSSNDAIKRYFIMKYINAREGYTRDSFMYNYNQVVRVLSDSSVYYGSYRSQFSPYNKDGPYASGNTQYVREVFLKSMLFITPTAVQVRVNITESGGKYGFGGDKLIYMEFDFKNLSMDDADRLINPLGFVVTLYRITDEVTTSINQASNNTTKTDDNTSNAASSKNTDENKENNNL